MAEHTPSTEQVRDAYVRRMRDTFVASTSEHEAEFNQWLSARDVEVRASELEAYAAVLDREYAEDAARSRVAGVRCWQCDLRYEERQQYGCGESGRAHRYEQDDLDAAAELDIEPTWDGDQARQRAATIRATAGSHIKRDTHG